MSVKSGWWERPDGLQGRSCRRELRLQSLCWFFTAISFGTCLETCDDWRDGVTAWDWLLVAGLRSRRKIRSVRKFPWETTERQSRLEHRADYSACHINSTDGSHTLILVALCGDSLVNPDSQKQKLSFSSAGTCSGPQGDRNWSWSSCRQRKVHLSQRTSYAPTHLLTVL